MRGKAFKSHILEKKSPKRKRGFRQETAVSPADRNVIKKGLGIG
jgi:large subunit ribosomal protein L35